MIPSIRLSTSFTYSGLSSHRIELRSCRYATPAVVPEPPNGSSTVPPSGQPARIQGSISSGGNVAKCAPLNAFGGTVHTLRLLAVSYDFSSPLCGCSPVPEL